MKKVQCTLYRVAVALSGIFAQAVFAQSLPGEGNACLPDLGNGQICTARDLRLSATVISGPAACEVGELISLEAQVVVSPDSVATYAAAERYSVAFFVGENGADVIDPPLGSLCTVSYLTPNAGTLDLTSGVGPYRELSKSPDSCGDIDANERTYHNITLNNILCADNNGDGRLDISAVATWEGNKNNSCSSPPVVSDFYPAQSSKCVYDPNVDLDIPIEQAPSIEVTKLALPSTLRAPGGTVTYTITVQNTSGATDPVTINALTDDRFGDLNGQGNCVLPVTVQPGVSVSCQFQQALQGSPGDTHINVVTAEGEDDEGRPVSGSDDAQVIFRTAGGIIPPPAAMRVTKTGSVASVPSPGGDVTYTVSVENTAVDLLELIDLTDDQVGGSLSGVGTCSVPQTLPSGGQYTCSYLQRVTGSAGDQIINTVTGFADPSASPGLITDSDSYTVTLYNVEPDPSVRVVKAVSPQVLDEPGGEVTYTITFYNESSPGDTVTITSVTDDKFGDLNGTGSCAVPVIVAPGASVSCSFTKTLTGNAGDSHVNVVTVVGEDDEGVPVSDSDDARVDFQVGIQAAMVVSKVGSPASLPEPGGEVEYTVAVGNSGDDVLTLIALDDDRVGGSLDGVGNCSLPQTLPVGFVYSCDYPLTVIGAAGSTVINTVTATANPAAASGGPITETATFPVTINDVPPNLRVIKTPLQAIAPHPGLGNTITLDYRLDVINQSENDEITLTALTDIQQLALLNPPVPPASAIPPTGGVAVDILSLPTPSGRSACGLTTLTTTPPGNRYICFFSRDATPSLDDPDVPGTTEPSLVLDTVVVAAEDDDGGSFTREDGAQVLLTADPTAAGEIDVIKTAQPLSLTQVPADVTYTVELVNVGATTVEITSLTDSVEGGAPVDVTNSASVESTTCGMPQTLTPEGSYVCEFVMSVDGLPGEGISDVVTASGTYGSGLGSGTVSGSDEATVVIQLPPLDIDVVKTASVRLAQSGEVVTFNVSVTNNSAERLFLSALNDSVYGDLDGLGTCSETAPLPVGSTYSCEFDAPVSSTFGPLHINTVTATATRVTKAELPGSSVSDSDRAFVLVLPFALTPAAAVPVGGGLLLLGSVGGVLLLARRYRIRL